MSWARNMPLLTELVSICYLLSINILAPTELQLIQHRTLIEHEPYYLCLPLHSLRLCGELCLSLIHLSTHHREVLTEEAEMLTIKFHQLRSRPWRGWS